MGEQVAARTWGLSSVGRAPALQAGGRGFESLWIHHFNIWRCSLAGYSVRFIPGRSGVQIPPPLPIIDQKMDLQLSWLELPAHNRSVLGSSPRRSTIYLHNLLTEKYPSLAEGIGLENRQGVTAAGVRIPLSPPFKSRSGAVVAHRAHNPEVVGSNPSSATKGPVVQWLTCQSVTLETASSSLVGTAILARQLSRQSNGLKIRVSPVRSRPKPPFQKSQFNRIYIYAVQIVMIWTFFIYLDKK